MVYQMAFLSIPDCKVWSARGTAQNFFGLFSVCAKFFDRLISAHVLRPVCCVTRTVFKKMLPKFGFQ